MLIIYFKKLVIIKIVQEKIIHEKEIKRSEGDQRGEIKMRE